MSQSLSDSGDEGTFAVVHVDYVGVFYHQFMTRPRVAIPSRVFDWVVPRIHESHDRGSRKYIDPDATLHMVMLDENDVFKFTPVLYSWGILHIVSRKYRSSMPGKKYGTLIHDYIPLVELVSRMTNALEVIHPDLVCIIIGYMFDLSFVPKNALKTR